MKKFIIHDAWNCTRYVGTKVRSSKKDHYAFKIGKSIKFFHISQVTLEKFVELPKKLKTKTIYKMTIKSCPYDYQFESIDECIKTIREKFRRSSQVDVNAYLRGIEIIPKIVIDI